jgi:DNA-binding transcriptional regulator YhcF (GntR family)
MIIPHTLGRIQVTFPSKSPQNLNNLRDFSAHTPYYDDALELYHLNLNVFPQPRGQKYGFHWHKLQYSRLANHSHFGLSEIVQGEVNLAVMCGRTSDNLFVIDCETQAALEYHMAQASARGIRLWVVKTARGGHLYLRCQDGEVENIKPGVLVDAEVRGRGGYVLAPPSLHPSGVVYTWLIREGDDIPLVSASQIDWLVDAKRKPVPLHVWHTGKRTKMPALSVISPYSNLSKTTRDYLREGHLIPEGTRNNRLFAAACDMAGNKYPYWETHQTLISIALKSGLPYDEAIHAIESAYSKHREPSRKREHREIPTHATWQLAMVFASQYDWSFKGGGNFRALFVALVERCRLGSNENGTFRATVRDVALLARMGVNTVQKILRAMQRMGGCHENAPALIQRAGRDKSSGGNLWRFSDHVLAVARQLVLENDGYKLPEHWLDFSNTLFGSDVAEAGGLGKTGTYLYTFMKTQTAPLSPKALAELTGLTRNQVNYALKRMSELGLIYRCGKGWLVIAFEQQELEDVVLPQRPKVDGRGRRRAKRFEIQRQAFVSRVVYCIRSYRDRHANLPRLSRTYVPLAFAPPDILEWLLEKSTQQEMRERYAFREWFLRDNGQWVILFHTKHAFWH